MVTDSLWGFHWDMDMNISTQLSISAPTFWTERVKSNFLSYWSPGVIHVKRKSPNASVDGPSEAGKVTCQPPPHMGPIRDNSSRLEMPVCPSAPANTHSLDSSKQASWRTALRLTNRLGSIQNSLRVPLRLNNSLKRYWRQLNQSYRVALMADFLKVN